MRTIVGTDELNKLKPNDPNIGRKISDIADSMLHTEITFIEKYSKSDTWKHRKKFSRDRDSANEKPRDNLISI